MGCCFNVEKFQIINIDEAVKLYQHFQNLFWKNVEKSVIKMWFPFNFAKKLKDRYFVVGGSKNLKYSPNTCFNVSFPKNVLPSFLLFSSVCY